MELLIERLANIYFWVGLVLIILNSLQILLGTEVWQNMKESERNAVKNGTYKPGASTTGIIMFVLWILSMYYK